jgi:hypothetical protein
MELSSIPKTASIYMVGKKHCGKSYLIDKIFESLGLKNGLRYEHIMYTTRTIQKTIEDSYENPHEYVVVEHTFMHKEEFEVLKHLIGKSLVIVAHQYPITISYDFDYLIYFRNQALSKKTDDLFYKHYTHLLSSFMTIDHFTKLCEKHSCLLLDIRNQMIYFVEFDARLQSNVQIFHAH